MMAKAAGNSKTVFAPRRKGVKLSTMNKHKRRNFKKYRGQGR
jgi:hypothetical protein